MSIRMTCRPCARGYRVPHTDREWTCKQCGEPLTATEPDETDPDEAGPPPSAEKRDKDELRRINAELKRWRASHKALKAYFILGPGVVLVMIGAAVAFLAFLYNQHLFAALTALASVGIGFATRWLYGLADRRPVPALTFFAILSTLVGVCVVIVGVLRMEFEAGKFFALVCFAAWAGVLQARRSERLLDSIPEAYRRKAREDRAQLTGPSVREQELERSRRRGRREGHLAVWILGGFAALVALGGAGYWYSLLPDDPAPTLQAFRESWERGNLDSVAAHANSRNIDRGLRRYWKERNWVDEPPALAGWNQTEVTDERLTVEYELANGLVSDTRWLWSEGRWRLIAFGFPE